MTVNQLQRQWFSSRVADNKPNTSLDQLKRVYLVGVLGNAGKDERLESLTKRWLASLGGTGSKTSDLLRQAMAVLGIQSTANFNENLRRFYLGYLP